MKELSNYINEKLDINNVRIAKKFPIKGSIKDVIEFLQDNGFTEMEHFRHPSRTKIDFDDRRAKTYLRSGEDSLYFADTSKKRISKENPIVFFGGRTRNFAYSDGETYHYFADNEVDKALELVNSIFRWE